MILIESDSTHRKKGEPETKHTIQDVDRVDLTTFSANNQLACEVQLLLQLKGFNRLERLERRDKQVQKGQSGSSTQRAVAQGAVIHFGLIGNSEHVDQLQQYHHFSLLDSRGVALQRDGTALVGSVNAIYQLNLVTGEMSQKLIESPWLAFVHSLAISPSGERMIVLSSGFDRIIEVDIDSGRVNREWIAWQHGYNRSNDGQTVVMAAADGSIVDGHTLIINSPDDYPGGLGLPPNLRTAFPNSAIYLNDHELLVTLFHHGMVKINLETGETSSIDDALAHAHAIHRTDHGFIVADTAHGCAIEYNELFERTRVIDFSAMEGLSPETNGRQWLQFIAPYGNGQYVAVDSNRHQVVFIDMLNRCIRKLPYNPNWVVQEAHLL